MMTSFNISVLRAGAPPLPTTYEAAAEIIQDKENEEQHEIILQDGEYECKKTIIADAVGVTVKSCVKVTPTDDGGMMVKVESSYKLIVPGPRVEQARCRMRIIFAGTQLEVGGASGSKVKMD